MVIWDHFFWWFLDRFNDRLMQPSKDNARRLHILCLEKKSWLLGLGRRVRCWMGRSSLWCISWLRHQMFYPYITISAAQACKSDDLRHVMSQFTLFLSYFLQTGKESLDMWCHKGKQQCILQKEGKFVGCIWELIELGHPLRGIDDWRSMYPISNPFMYNFKLVILCSFLLVLTVFSAEALIFVLLHVLFEFPPTSKQTRSYA